MLPSSLHYFACYPVYGQLLGYYTVFRVMIHWAMLLLLGPAASISSCRYPPVRVTFQHCDFLSASWFLMCVVQSATKTNRGVPRLTVPAAFAHPCDLVNQAFEIRASLPRTSAHLCRILSAPYHLATVFLLYLAVRCTAYFAALACLGLPSLCLSGLGCP